MEFLKTIPQFLKEVHLELRKVNWPNRQETLRYTLIVVGFSAAVALLLGAFDFLFGQILNRFVF